MNPTRVLLMQLSERTSAKGNRYLAGWLGKASVVAFQAEEPDKFGNPVWDLFVSTPEPKPEGKSAKLAGSASGDAPAKPSARQRPESVAQRSPARHQGQRDGWRGSVY